MRFVTQGHILNALAVTHHAWVRMRAVLLAIEGRGVARHGVVRLPRWRDVLARCLACGRAHALCRHGLYACKHAQRCQYQRDTAHCGDSAHDVPPVRSDPSPRVARAGGSGRLVIWACI